jgi:hypothetical protein
VSAAHTPLRPGLFIAVSLPDIPPSWAISWADADSSLRIPFTVLWFGTLCKSLNAQSALWACLLRAKA